MAVWTEHKTKDGRSYFYNKHTKESVWERPEGFVSKAVEASATNLTPEWEERMDKKTQRLYYYDRVNKISQWIKPDGDVHITSYVNKDRESKTDGSSTTTTATENVATDGAAINATDIASASKESTSTAKGSSNESSVKKHHHHHARKDFEKKPDDDDENTDDLATSKADGAKSSLQEWEGDEDDSSKSKKRKKRDKGASSTKSKAKKLHKQGDFQRAKKSTSTIIRDSFDVAGGLQVSMESTDEANQLLQLLGKTDSIMELDILSTINGFLRTHPDANGPEMLVKQLSTAYRGHAQMCRLLGSWLDASIPETKSSRMSLAKTPDNDVDADTLIFHALKQAIMDRYDPKLLSNVLSDSIAEPEWLNTMLHDRKWRLMLIELAEKHKTCSLLQYAIRRISEAGHHKEIASITNANDVFPVFNAIVADILKRIPFAGVDDVREDYRALEKICAHAAYLYMYTQEALLVLNEALCKDPTMQPARSKLERLRQSLHETVLVKHGAQKLDALHVVKRAAIARPYPALSEAISLVLQENKCSLAACELLKTVYTSSTPPPVAHLREHVILQRLTTALFHPYEAMENAAHRTACAFVLAYAATVQDPRPLLATTTTDTLEWSDEHVQGIAAALEAASIVCKSETTLSYNVRESNRWMLKHVRFLRGIVLA
ncbi:hypothetical protein, variant 2 [Aphanomyces invadans]|uniref:WW domain-containing protein n=1 Tax=Aphanomyces invadans TaxID=157072 RepID=A0A024U3Q0_9STRA|nr:hypothetical protein, variant 2 [Aphanomyces invadans]ETW00248.1 hypothetical protein, variant 2 [Aphanomyces invadans]|eukprot:XP_008871273.1 hypothetical protein, variant 2 [Aphanomyces invadans]